MQTNTEREEDIQCILMENEEKDFNFDTKYCRFFLNVPCWLMSASNMKN